MQVNLTSPKTLGELEKGVNEVGQSISIEFLKRHWESMKNRIALVKKSKGQKIKY